MIQIVILGLAALCFLMGLRGFSAKGITVSSGTTVNGPAGRKLGIALVGLAMVMVIFALIILPRL